MKLFLCMQIILHTVGIQVHWQRPGSLVLHFSVLFFPECGFGSFGVQREGCFARLSVHPRNVQPLIDLLLPVLEGKLAEVTGHRSGDRGYVCLLGGKMRHGLWETLIWKGDSPCVDREVLEPHKPSCLPALHLFSSNYPVWERLATCGYLYLIKTK